MTDFAIVAIALAMFLSFGVAMGVMIVTAFSRRPRGPRFMDGGDWQEPSQGPEDDGKHPWYGR